MKNLKDKIQNGLDESRILVLAVQIVIGFQFGAVFQEEFQSFPAASQYLGLFALGSALIGLCLLLWPAAFHQIAAQGHDRPSVLNFTNRVMIVALLPLALALGADLYICMARLMSEPRAAIFAGVITAGALFLWYGGKNMTGSKKSRRSVFPSHGEKQVAEASTTLSEKIKHVLTEARMVIPGAQALLGFQFATFFQKQFSDLERSSQNVHLISLTLMALSIILLMTPAAYHRIVNQGEDTEEFFRLASRMIIIAMVPLAVGLCGDFYVVTRKMSDSTTLAVASAAGLLILFLGTWFAYTGYRRTHNAESSPSS